METASDHARKQAGNGRRGIACGWQEHNSQERERRRVARRHGHVLPSVHSRMAGVLVRIVNDQQLGRLEPRSQLLFDFVVHALRLQALNTAASAQ
jgi:hypothetical protein